MKAVAAVRVDERAEFESAFNAVRRSAFLLARHMGRDTEAATDIVQEAPPRQRAALWLRNCDDLAVTDVAGILSCSEPAAKQLLPRARETLRERLETKR